MKTDPAKVCRSELEQAVFQALYDSPQQKFRRGRAFLILLGKHGMRGLLVLWPVYSVMILVAALPGTRQYLPYLLILLPGLLVWLYVYILGARTEYAHRVQGRLLPKQLLRYFANGS